MKPLWDWATENFHALLIGFVAGTMSSVVHLGARWAWSRFRNRKKRERKPKAPKYGDSHHIAKLHAGVPDCEVCHGPKIPNEIKYAVGEHAIAEIGKLPTTTFHWPRGGPTEALAPLAVDNKGNLGVKEPSAWIKNGWVISKDPTIRFDENQLRELRKNEDSRERYWKRYLLGEWDSPDPRDELVNELERRGDVSFAWSHAKGVSFTCRTRRMADHHIKHDEIPIYLEGLNHPERRRMPICTCEAQERFGGFPPYEQPVL